MNAIAFVLLALLVLSVVMYIAEQLPLPPMPKRIGQGVLMLVFLWAVAQHFHWLRG